VVFSQYCSEVKVVLRPQFKMSTKGPEINSEGGVHVDLETTGNGQKEPAFDTLCVFSNFHFFVPPTQKVSNASSI
jgi:hypothetical protein